MKYFIKKKTEILLIFKIDKITLFVNYRINFLFIKANVSWNKSNRLKGIKGQILSQYAPISQFFVAKLCYRRQLCNLQTESSELTKRESH